MPVALAYRLTIYAPPSVDPTEATVLTPPATAADGTARAHSDPCQVATIPLAGYQPYLGIPTIRWGSINPVTGAADIGYCNVPVFDVRTGSANAQRWWSAFLGDATGRSAMLGCRAVLEESTDGGTSWASVFVGRVQGRSLDDVLTYGLEIREPAERFKAQAFVGRPHSAVTYAWHGQVWPPYRALRHGAIPQVNGLMGTVTGSGPWTLTNVQVDPARNLVSEAMAAIGVASAEWGSGTALYRNYLTFNTSAARPYQLRARSDSGREFGVSRIDFVRSVVSGRNVWRVTSMNLNTLPVGTVGYTASAPDQGGYKLVTSPWAAPTEDVPLQIADVHPVRLWRDLLLGYFGVLNEDGTVPAGRGVAINTAAFTAAESWPLYPVRAIVSEPAELGEWVQKHLLEPNRLSYHINGAGEVVPVRLSRVTSVAGLPTITDAELLAQPSWRESAAGAVERVDVTAQSVS
ncbi:MAG: hypothetical protein ACK52I_04130, partial [Pseudomonadota bacterium]